jgi:PHP family Zn ribbon phosphoesterase
LHRINELADRPYGVMPKSASKYTYAVPLIEVIAYITGKGRNTQQVKNLYSKLVKEFGNELNVLLSEDIARLREIDPKLSEAIENIREKHVNLVPGYDGVFGIVDILNKMKNAEITWKGKQSTMKDF